MISIGIVNDLLRSEVVWENGKDSALWRRYLAHITSFSLDVMIKSYQLPYREDYIDAVVLKKQKASI